MSIASKLDQPRARSSKLGQQDPGTDPTPEEIAQACWNFKQHWTEQQERLRRGVHREGPYEFPRVADRLLFGNES
jgi:hypothetical protein